ncbi:hypothetical protein M9458_023323, partial [Cirrhinus mrigala]
QCGRNKRHSEYESASKEEKEDEKPISVVEPQHEAVQKISLAPGSMAEDTLEKLRERANTSEIKIESQEELECILDESSADLTVESGPSSPCRP